MKKNDISIYFEIKKEIIRKNRVVDHSKIELEIESANNDLSNIRFFIKK